MSEWISVKDELPSTFSIVRVKRFGGGILDVYRSRENFYYYKSGLHAGFLSEEDVWMPLPEPPK
jgi:hypothetical protein